MRIAVVGTGYVGLVSGACLASKGHNVTCVDVDPEKVAKINSKVPPIFEIGLQDMMNEVIPSRLRATGDLAGAVRGADLTLIAVGTPFDGDLIDLKYIREAARQIGEALRTHDAYHVVVVKSTVVPGTTEDVVLPILEAASGKKAGADFGVGMNPEFLKEGEAIADFMSPDRIVLGGIDARTRKVMAGLYEVFPDADVVETTPRTAEMIKYVANSLLATLISFSNEMGNLSAKLGVDAVEVMRGVHLDKRFMPILADGTRVTPGMISYLAAGCGFGGSCFPKDVKALIAHGRERGAAMDLLDSVIRVNANQPQKMLDMLTKHAGALGGLNVAVLGMAFKPGTDDIRESPSLPVTQALIDAGANVTAFDPIARHEAEKVFPSGVRFEDKLEDAVSGSQAILLMTGWPEFRSLPGLLAERGDTPVVIDGRRLLPKGSVTRYDGIGLPG
ncbi:UDP-glucose dehydrogenase family protein [Hyphomonas sp.]|uniref:UDP-glucose dehydrogenase family protein n=1 Tax=Hyphomonas sp. TaxID=87 RepID=UPI0039196063